MNVPPFNKYLGVDVVTMGEGRAEARLNLSSHHMNLRGVAHGGVVSSLLDTALGASVISVIPKEWWCATISLSIQFVRGAGEGPLRAEGRVKRKGARTAFAEGEVFDAAGLLVAHAHGSWHLWPRKPGTSSSSPVGAEVALDPSGQVMSVGKIIAVGRNYAAHIEEMGGDLKRSAPVVFLKPNSAMIQDGGSVEIPSGLGEVHHEVELVVIIGRKGRRIPVDRALEYVEGFAVGLDMTLRDVQAKAKKSGEPWALAKGFDTSAPISRGMSREVVGDGSGLRLTLKVNGEIRQEGSTDLMIHSPAELVSLASHLMTLERGDLIFTGTPSGVGAVQAGDVLEAELEKVGTLRVSVKDAG